MSGNDPLTSSPPHVEYLLPRMESFWRWSADGRAVEWRDGRTIAFREEVLAVLRRLADRGLPEFGAVVLLLAATRDNWNEAADKAERILGGYCVTRDPAPKTSSSKEHLALSFSAVVPHRARQELSDVLGDLEAVASLPIDLRTSIAAKAVLAALVFDGATETLSPSDSAQVISLLEGGIDPADLARITGWDERYERFAEELYALQRGLGRVAAEPLSLLMATGVDRTVNAADLELPAALRVRGLIRDLKNDVALAGIAKLARDLLAAIHLPRILVSPEDLPVGGVSDISNRGPLDRLLVSELAQEDLTLVIRIALGEALYLRRESPAQHPPIGRAILIDCGIRMWGVSRLYATAVAMALLALSDERGRVSVHRSRNSIIEPVDLLTRTGVMNHLSVLSPTPQPGASLESFLRAVDSVKGEQTELFVVTHARVLDDPHFQTALRRDPTREWHIATVADDGAFALWLISRAGKRQLCRASLSLDDLLAEPKAKTEAPPSIVIGKEFPEIERLARFPLLLPARVKPSRCAFSDSLGLVGITGDRRLMHWAEGWKKGGRQLLSRLPNGQVLGVVLDDNDHLAHALIHRGERQTLHVLTVNINSNLDTPLIREQKLEMHRPPLHVMCANGWIYIFQRNGLVLISSTGSQVRQRAYPSGMQWRMGRFLHHVGTGWHAATPDGFHWVARRPAIAVFDRGQRGPWVIMPNGDVLPSEEAVNAKEERDLRFSFWGASNDGERIFAHRMSRLVKTSGVYRYDFEQRTWQAAPTNREYIQSVLLTAKQLCNEPLNIRNRFGSIGISADGRLSLFDRRGHVVLLRCPDDGPMTLESMGVSAVTIGPRAAFRKSAAPEGVRYSLRLAEWSDGSRAYLDSRGLLHLISSDPKLPQMTLTLTTGPLAAWTSAGQRIGDGYFFESEPNAQPASVAKYLKSFGGRLA